MTIGIGTIVLIVIIKKDAGRITGSRRLKTEGRTGQAAGDVKQAADKIGDAFKH